MTVNNTNLIAVLYFLEEALGFRVSLHWLRRFLETQDPQDLGRLIISVTRESLVDYDTWSHLVADGYRLADGLTPDQARQYLREKLSGPCLLDVLADPHALTQVANMYFSGTGWVINRLLQAIRSAPDVNWQDALSRNQVKSKVWLLDTMDRVGWLDRPNLVLVGGWVGLLPVLAHLRNRPVRAAVNFDLDPEVHFPARLLNAGPFYSFQSQQRDVRQVDLAQYSDHVIVDTIVEHFQDHQSWVRQQASGTRMVLQGNDMFDVPDHVNCHASLEEFVNASGLSEIIWQGQLDLPGCTRFMVLGKV